MFDPNVLTLIGVIFGAVLTYLGTRGKTKADIEAVVNARLQLLLDEREADVTALRKDVQGLRERVETLEKALRAARWMERQLLDLLSDIISWARTRDQEAADEFQKRLDALRER